MKYWSRIISLIMVMVICFSFVYSSVGAANINFISNDSKIDSYLSEKLEAASPNELIPVHIWYKDIDQNLVEQSVEKECGFTKEELAIDYEMPSVELIASYKNGDTSSKSEMSNYMKRTEKLRLKEKERTDKYVMTRRNISRIKYNEKSNRITRNLDILDDRIIFRSEYAPTFIAELTKNEIERLKKDNTIESIEYYFPLESVGDEEVDNVIALERDVLNIVEVNNTLGLTGDGVKIGMFENNHPDAFHDSINSANIINRNSGNNGQHATDVARIMVGDSDGIAKDATLYSVINPSEYSRINKFDYSQFEWLVSQGVSVINISYGLRSFFAIEHSYSFAEKWIDYLVANHNVTVVKSAGNDGEYSGRVTIPGLAHNVITVGAYSTNYTPEITDDYLEKYSSWSNSGVLQGVDYEAIEKPDVIMPGDITTTEYIGETIEEATLVDENEENHISQGTSFATPFLTGSIALMLELKPSLSAFPQAIKAIVLASCHRKVGRSERNEAVETLEGGITECQGAGVPDVWTMACIISQGTYGTGVLGGTETKINIVQPPYGAEKINFSTAWLRGNYVEDDTLENTSPDDVTLVQSSNIDLSIYKNDYLIGISNLANSSTEMCYVDITNDEDFNYHIKLTQNSNPINLKYAYAWSTNNMYAPVTRSGDGIYHVKNSASGRYLTYDTSTTTPNLIMRSVNASLPINETHKWIIECDQDSCNISTGYGANKLYLGQGSTLSGTSYAAQLNSTVYEMHIQNNKDGTISFLNSNKDRILTYSGANLVWLEHNSESTTLPEKYKWCLDKVNYLYGDVNMDGFLITYETNDGMTLHDSDQTYLHNYLSGSINMNNLQKFLADINKDGVIDYLDVSMINSFAINKFV